MLNAKRKYGFRDQRAAYIYYSDTLDIHHIASLIMAEKEALEYTVDEEIRNDGEEFFTISYSVSNCEWGCSLRVYINHLLEIEGTLFKIPLWGLDDRAIETKKAKRVC